MQILVSNWVALFETSLIAKEKRQELLDFFPKHMVEQAEAFNELLDLDIIPIINEIGAYQIYPMKEGGILAALWDMAKTEQTGIDVDLTLVPIRQETIEISEYYDINPYRMNSRGSELIISEYGDEIQKALNDNGIMARLVGSFTKDNDRVVRYDGHRRFLTPPSRQ